MVDGVAVVVGRVVVGLGLAVVVDVTVPVVDVGGNDVVEKSVSEPEHAAASSATMCAPRQLDPSSLICDSMLVPFTSANQESESVRFTDS